jgi:hypothetical protein
MSLCVRHLCQHFTFWYSLKKQITEILLNQLESIYRNDVCEVHFEKFLISWQLCKIHGHHWQFLFFLLIDWNLKKKKKLKLWNDWLPDKNLLWGMLDLYWLKRYTIRATSSCSFYLDVNIFNIAHSTCQELLFNSAIYCQI